MLRKKQKTLLLRIVLMQGIIILLCLFPSPGHFIYAQQQQPYQPQYKHSWQTVYKKITDTWHLSRVDTGIRRGRNSLVLPFPYFTIRPGRNILFGWDTYFTNAGLLLIDSLLVYARNAIENQFAEIEQLGYIPNASESWGLNRSQTPFLSMMVKEWYEKYPDKTWLRKAYDHLKKEYLFWTDTSSTAIENHATAIPGLQRFYHHATKQELLSFYAQIAPRFGFSDSLPEQKKLEIGEAWMSEAETGMDFTPRFENRCHQFIAPDLNANLYMYEMNFAWMVKELGLQGEPAWSTMAEKRKQLLTQYCWDKNRGVFMDYDFVNKRFSAVTSVATFYPLWAGLATKEQAAGVVKNLYRFEFAWGPTICEPADRGNLYQWDYPAGWPPMYYIVIKALHNYGYYTEAKRIAAKYLDVVTRNFLTPEPPAHTLRRNGREQSEHRMPGAVYEKYNVSNGTIYDAEYPSRTFHGWSYGVFVWALQYYSKKAD